MVQEADTLKSNVHTLIRCCSTSSSDDDHDKTFHEKYNLEKLYNKDGMLIIHKQKSWYFPPEIGVVDNTKVNHCPRQPYTSTKKEKQYQSDLRRSWRETHLLLGMDPNTEPPIFDKAYDAELDNTYSKYAVFGGVYFLADVKFVFIEPAEDIEALKKLFTHINNPAFELVDEIGRIKMFVAETLRMLHRTLDRNRCILFRKCYELRACFLKDGMAIDRNIQPWEASFLGTDGIPVMHASRGNTHDVTITDYYNVLCYIVRTDSGRFPRHYNIVDAKTSGILCQLCVPIPPDDDILGNFDVLLDGKRIAKIRQGGWKFATNSNRIAARARHAVHLHSGVHPELKAFIICAAVNAHFTFNVSKDPEDVHNNHLEKCNPDLWNSVFPNTNSEQLIRNDWYEIPEGIRRLSSTSLEIKASEFFSRYLEEKVDFTHDYADMNEVGLPYYKPMPPEERMKRNLYWVTSNRVGVLDQGYANTVVPFNTAEVRELINRKKKNFKRRQDNPGKTHEGIPTVVKT